MDRRHDRRSQRDEHAETVTPPDGRDRKRKRAEDVSNENGKQARGTQREEIADRDAERRSDQGDDERLEQDHPANLLAGGPDGSQQAKLPGALRDDDAERVDDDVRANEERDQRERDREDVDVVQDRVERVRLLLRLLLARDRAGAVWNDLGDGVDEGVRIDTVIRDHGDRLEVWGCGHRVRGRVRNQSERGAL